MDSCGINLGQYENICVFLKEGKFGKYIEWNERKKSIITSTPLDQITLSDALHTLEEMRYNTNTKTEQNIIRKINDNLTIRNGKYGHYIYYKTDKMRKPIFLNISKFPLDYTTCELREIQSWFKLKYKIDLEI